MHPASEKKNIIMNAGCMPMKSMAAPATSGPAVFPAYCTMSEVDMPAAMFP